MGRFRFKIRKYFRSQEDFFGKSLLLYMVIYGIIYKAIYFLIYLFLKQECIFSTLVSESPIFLKNGKNFYFLPCVPKKTIFLFFFNLSCGRIFLPQVYRRKDITITITITIIIISRQKKDWVLNVLNP